MRRAEKAIPCASGGMGEAENTDKNALPGIETQVSKLYCASTAALRPGDPFTLDAGLIFTAKCARNSKMPAISESAWLGRF